MKQVIKITIVLSMMMLGACYNPKLNITSMPNVPTQGPPDYIDGWKAGCETGMATYSNSYLRSRYRTSVDPARMTNPVYNKGWELGQRYCSYYVSTYLSNTEMASLTNDEYTRSDLRESNTWISLETDEYFSYEGFDTFTW